MRFQHILLSVDLGDDSSWRKSLPTAIGLCRSQNASLHVLTVVPDFGMSIIDQYFPKGYEEDVAGKILEQLHAFVKQQVPEEIKVQHIVGRGTVYEVILNVAKEINADLIVVSSHRPELKDYLLGPNASRVVRHANCSVMVIRD